MVPRAASSPRASVTPCADSTSICLGQRVHESRIVERIHIERSSTISAHADATLSPSIPSLPIRPSISSPIKTAKKCVCATKTTITKTETLTIQVAHSPHIQCHHGHAHGYENGNERQYVYHPGYKRVPRSDENRHTTLETLISAPHMSLCSVAPRSNVGAKSVITNVNAESAGTRTIIGVVPGIPKPKPTTKIEVFHFPSEHSTSPPPRLDDDDDNNQAPGVNVMGVIPGTTKFLRSASATLAAPISVSLPIVSTLASTSASTSTSSTSTSTSNMYSLSTPAPFTITFASTSQPTHPYTLYPLSQPQAKTPSPSTLPSNPTTSPYPHPSPPTFLYPSPIVPYQPPHHQHNPPNTTPLYAPTTLARMDYTFTYIPAGYKILLYTSIALGLLWAVVVYYVNFPPAFLAGGGGTTREKRGEKNDAKGRKGREGGREERSGWVRYTPGWLVRACGKEERKRKPFDKPSKYALVPTSSSSSSNYSTGLDDHSIGSSTSTSTTPWLNKHKSLNGNDRSDSSPGIELEQRQRRPRVENPSVHSAILGPVPDRSIANTAPAAPSTEQQSHSTPTPTMHTSTPLSPVNPYLPAPLQRRSSSEWLRDHSVFFSPSFSATNPPHAHPSPAPPTSSLDEIDALEAQTPTSASTSVFQSPSMARHLGSGREGGKKAGGGYKRTGIWLDMVDGAVNRAVGKVARWTEDGRDEGLLLPLAKGD